MARKVLNHGVFFVRRRKEYIVYTDGKVEIFYVNSDAEFVLEELKTLIKDLGYVGEIS